MRWANTTINMIDFLVPTKNNTEKLVEQTMCSTSYTNIRDNPTKYRKPQYNALFKSIRKANSELITYLNRLTPSEEGVAKHKAKENPPLIQPNWKVRFKRLRNCTFLSLKYRQLVYQNTTNSVVDRRAFLTPSATTYHQMLGSSGSIKKWRKHQRVGENIENNFAQSVQNIFSEKTKRNFNEKNSKNSKHGRERQVHD